MELRILRWVLMIIGIIILYFDKDYILLKISVGLAIVSIVLIIIANMSSKLK